MILMEKISLGIRLTQNLKDMVFIRNFRSGIYLFKIT